jgi:hypothetical protein
MGRVGKSVAAGRLYKEDGYTEEGLRLEGRLKEEVLQGERWLREPMETKSLEEVALEAEPLPEESRHIQ